MRAARSERLCNVLSIYWSANSATAGVPSKRTEELMKKLVFALTALSLLAGSAPSVAAGCRDAKGKFIKCAKPTKCRDAKGHFTKCK
jgi:hypothetical protein